MARNRSIFTLCLSEIRITRQIRQCLKCLGEDPTDLRGGGCYGAINTQYFAGQPQKCIVKQRLSGKKETKGPVSTLIFVSQRGSRLQTSTVTDSVTKCALCIVRRQLRPVQVHPSCIPDVREKFRSVLPEVRLAFSAIMCILVPGVPLQTSKKSTKPFSFNPSPTHRGSCPHLSPSSALPSFIRSPCRSNRRGAERTGVLKRPYATLM